MISTTGWSVLGRSGLEAAVGEHITVAVGADIQVTTHHAQLATGSDYAGTYTNVAADDSAIGTLGHAGSSV